MSAGRNKQAAEKRHGDGGRIFSRHFFGRSDVQRRVERVVLDEFATGFDHIAHQLGE